MRAFILSGKPYLAEELRKLTAAAFLAIVVISLPYPATLYAQEGSAPNKAEIDTAVLLDQLRGANAGEAEKIARDIKRSWSRSGSASADLLLKRGRDALQAKKPKIAVEHLTALIDHAPDFAEGWHMRASAYYQQRLYGPAVEDLANVLALNPNHFDALQGLGAVFEQLGDSKRAYEVYEKVLTIHPHHGDVLEAMERLDKKVNGPAL
ncbi:tetratricopeptide repeat protein [Planktotalea sp.]|uniref:tetratricopeptide repeat protein n=1 Tax=Planktotalea sp. TaxID=2029877 RepID=UPI00329748D1